jgi:hypothetical protein
MPHTNSQRPLSFASRDEVEDEYGAPPGYQLPGVQNCELDNSGGKTARVLTSSPSVLLQPNRVGSDGDIESRDAQELPTTGGWVNNWTTQFKSPLGEFLTPLYLLVVSTDVPQMLCNHTITDLVVAMSLFSVSVRGSLLRTYTIIP